MAPHDPPDGGRLVRRDRAAGGARACHDLRGDAAGGDAAGGRPDCRPCDGLRHQEDRHVSLRRRHGRLHRAEEGLSHLGKTDPFWAILSDPGKQVNRGRIDEFFERGTPL